MKSITLVLLMLAMSTPLWGQAISESIMQMNLGANNGFSMDLPDYDQKFTAGVWRDYLKDFKGKTKKVKRSTELFTDDANISYLSDNTVDLYSDVERSGNGSTLNLWVDLGGAFADSENHGEAVEGIELFLEGFAKQLNVETIKLELKAEEKELKSLQSKLSKLQNLNEKYHREIENWKEKISQNEEKIVVNIKDQEDAESAIDQQKDKVKDVELKLAKAEN